MTRAPSASSVHVRPAGRDPLPGGGRGSRLGGPLAGRPGRTRWPGRSHRRQPSLSRRRGHDRGGGPPPRHPRRPARTRPLRPGALPGPAAPSARSLQVVRKMAAAVRPGGWLLIEDADYVSLAAANPAHPRAARFDQIVLAGVLRLVCACVAAGGVTGIGADHPVGRDPDRPRPRQPGELALAGSPVPSDRRTGQRRGWGWCRTGRRGRSARPGSCRSWPRPAGRWSSGSGSLLTR